MKVTSCSAALLILILLNLLFTFIESGAGSRRGLFSRIFNPSLSSFGNGSDDTEISANFLRWKNEKSQELNDFYSSITYLKQKIDNFTLDEFLNSNIRNPLQYYPLHSSVIQRTSKDSFDLQCLYSILKTQGLCIKSGDDYYLLYIASNASTETALDKTDFSNVQTLRSLLPQHSILVLTRTDFQDALITFKLIEDSSELSIDSMERIAENNDLVLLTMFHKIYALNKYQDLSSSNIKYFHSKASSKRKFPVLRLFRVLRGRWRPRTERRAVLLFSNNASVVIPPGSPFRAHPFIWMIDLDRLVVRGQLNRVLERALQQLPDGEDIDYLELKPSHLTPTQSSIVQGHTINWMDYEKFLRPYQRKIQRLKVLLQTFPLASPSRPGKGSSFSFTRHLLQDYLQLNRQRHQQHILTHLFPDERTSLLSRYSLSLLDHFLALPAAEHLGMAPSRTSFRIIDRVVRQFALSPTPSTPLLGHFPQLHLPPFTMDSLSPALSQQLQNNDVTPAHHQQQTPPPATRTNEASQTTATEEDRIFLRSSESGR